jgi:hypothetical protein
MKKAKIAMIWVLLVFFLQETGMTYQGGYESLSEYASENSESREECVYHQVAKPEAKKSAEKRKHLFVSPGLHTSYKEVFIGPVVKRSILYRTLLI